MRKRADDFKCCETCNHCARMHIKKGDEYYRGMLHYCETRKRIVDKDDKCRKWQKSELLCKFEQEDMSAILAQLKVRLSINTDLSER